MDFETEKLRVYLQKCQNFFRVLFLHEKYALRDSTIILALIIVLAIGFGIQKYLPRIAEKQIPVEENDQEILLSELSSEQAVQKEQENVSEIQSRVDSSKWVPY